eukprot:scaffold106027_cov36-Phaeocystis_antarctica.AAC.1
MVQRHWGLGAWALSTSCRMPVGQVSSVICPPVRRAYVTSAEKYRGLVLLRGSGGAVNLAVNVLGSTLTL